MSLNGKKGVVPGVDCSKDKGFTVQADRDDADINKVIARLERGASLARVNSREPFYGDVSEFSGLADSIRKVKDAEALFMGYDASLRERFDNDPVKMVDFLSDAANYDEALKLGLVLARPESQPPVVPPASPPSLSGGK